MPISALGSSVLSPACRHAVGPPRGRPGGWPRSRVRGFTLIELLVVITLVAIASATITLALRDPAAAQLEREAERLATLLDAARAEARVAGLPVRWHLMEGGAEFRFEGLPPDVQLPRRWLGEEAPAVELLDGPVLRLGPEPMIGAQRLRLTLGQQQLTLASDGLGPFRVLAPEPVLR